MAEPIKIGLLGMGVVGTGVLENLAENQEKLTNQIGRSLTVTKAFVRPSKEKEKLAEKFDLTLVYEVEEILQDKEIAIVIETMGTIEPAKAYISASLKAGKHVVTANKDLLATHGTELIELAAENKVNLYYEASVAGGIPILRTLATSFAGDNISKVLGIVNGTTNFMLTKMVQEQRTYQDTLDEATALGFAESDPTNDVDGIDAAYKMVILSKFAFGMTITMDQMTIRGIRGLSAEDVAVAGKLGYAVKLIGSAIKINDSIHTEVGPVLVPKNHPLAAVQNEYNAVFVESSGIGESMYYGPGAGGRPTGTSIVADLAAIAQEIENGTTGRPFSPYQQELKLTPKDQIINSYFFSLEMPDHSGQFLKLAEIFTKLDAGFEQVSQAKGDGEKARVVIITHPISETTYAEIQNQIQLKTKFKFISSMKVMEEK